MSFKFLLAGAVALVPSLSLAHVTIEPTPARQGAAAKIVLRIPHGCNGAATNAVRVRIPEGFVDVKPMPKAGWTLATQRGAYARSYELGGKPIAEGVQEIVWSGGALPDDQYEEFVFRAVATVAPRGGRAYFPTTQDCGAANAAWTEIPSPDQDGHALKNPAPSLTVDAAAGASAKHDHAVHMAQAGSGHDAGHSAAHAAATGGPTYKAGAIVIDTPWTRATPKGAQVAGGFMRLTNTGATPDRLIGGSFPLSKRFEIHEMTLSGGMMKMRPIDGGLVIPPGATVELKPGSFHVMMIDLDRPIETGAPIKGVLTFEKAGDVAVDYAVAKIGAASPEPTAMQHMQMQHQPKP